MSESLECLGSESNMQIPSETRSKPHTLRTQTQLREWRVGELVVEFVNAGALQRLLCARWFGILRCRVPDQFATRKCVERSCVALA